MDNLKYQKMLFYTFLFCIAFLHSSVGNQDSWPKQKPSRGTKPQTNIHGGTIDIDNPQGGYDGSADHETSGNGPYGSDDEDDEMEISGSHEVSHTGLTACQRQRLLAARTSGEHQPVCTSVGDYETVQCNAGYCWCVNSDGVEILNSRQWRIQPDCRNLERKQVVIAPPESVPPKTIRDPDVVINDRGGMRETPNVVNHQDGLEDDRSSRLQIFDHPGILAGIIGGAVFGLLCAVLLVMFIVYRMRKNDDSAYPMKTPPPAMGYMRTPQVFT